MHPIIMIAGPTAVGKTDLSLELAGRLGAEIVSADSRQIYKELTIGTAKPSESDLRRARHHFIDEISLAEEYSAGKYQAEANRRIAEIQDRGAVPLVVGGSTLYLRALRYGLADIPRVPRLVRENVMQRLEAHGVDALYDDLKSFDPVAARTMDKTKTQRLIRAIEVFEATGRTLTSFHEEQSKPPHRFKTFVLFRNRTKLYERIEERVDAMLANGLLDEVRAILDRGHDPMINPLRTIGYRESISYLKGEISREEMVRLVKRNSRRYAKRQLTWFRRDETNIWIRADRPISEQADFILKSR